MKTIKLAAATLLILGLSAVSYAQMSKCGGSGNMKQGKMQGGMMMNGDMKHDRGIMMQHLKNIKSCVKAAQTTEELQQCNMNMQQNAPMMQQGKMMQQVTPMKPGEPAAKEQTTPMKPGQQKCGGGR